VAGVGIGAVVAWMVAAFYRDEVRSLTAIRCPHPAALVQVRAQVLALDPQHGLWLRPLPREQGRDLRELAASLADEAAVLGQLLLENTLPQSFLDRYRAASREPGALRAAQSWLEALSLEEFSCVPVVAAPSLLIWNEEPEPTSVTAAEATRPHVAGRFTEVQLPGASCFLLETAPAEVLAAMREHLASR
jgi:pimeloyl-ACP methyl ester carboxylesterase